MSSEIRFDLSALQGKYTSIDSMTLRLYTTAVSSTSATLKIAQPLWSTATGHGSKEPATERRPSPEQCVGTNNSTIPSARANYFGGAGQQDQIFHTSNTEVAGTANTWVDLPIDANSDLAGALGPSPL